MVVNNLKQQALKSKAGRDADERKVAANNRMITSVDPQPKDNETVKVKRRNYSKGVDYKVMKSAIEDWNNMKGEYFDPKT